MCISHSKAAETQPHKSKVTALQLHDPRRGQRWTAAGACGASWPRHENECIATIPLLISAPCSSHGIQLGRSIFSALSMKEKSISVLPFSFSLSLSTLSPGARHQLTAPRIPDEGRDADYQEDQSTPCHPFYPPPQTILIINYGKAYPVQPCDGHAHLLLVPCPDPSPRWDDSVNARDRDIYRWITLIPKSGPSPSSCVIRKLK